MDFHPFSRPYRYKNRYKAKWVGGFLRHLQTDAEEQDALLVPQRLDRIELRRAACRKETKDHADRG
jgi:hypothetical protein